MPADHRDHQRLTRTRPRRHRLPYGDGHEEQGEDDRTVVTEILTSHPKGEAEELLRSVRDAVRACADGFRTTSEDGPSTYTGVKALPAAEAARSRSPTR